jgi:hypothetical protein
LRLTSLPRAPGPSRDRAAEERGRRVRLALFFDQLDQQESISVPNERAGARRHGFSLGTEQHGCDRGECGLQEVSRSRFPWITVS